MRKETVMNITEREIDDPEKGDVILEYVNFTKEFAEIKEYVRSKGESIRGYTDSKLKMISAKSTPDRNRPNWSIPYLPIIKR